VWRTYATSTASARTPCSAGSRSTAGLRSATRRSCASSRMRIGEAPVRPPSHASWSRVSSCGSSCRGSSSKESCSEGRAIKPHVASKAPWHSLEDSLPQYSEGAGRFAEVLAVRGRVALAPSVAGSIAPRGERCLPGSAQLEHGDCSHFLSLWRNSSFILSPADFLQGVEPIS